MLPFSAWVPHRPESGTRIWVLAVYLVVIPRSRSKEARSELKKRAKFNK